MTLDIRDGDILPIEIMARKEDWQDGVSIYMRQRTVGEGAIFAEPIRMIKRDKGVFVEPMMTITIHSAQQLMDGLWECGLRPTGGSGSAGSLAATERHLKDMRALVFKNKP